MSARTTQRKAHPRSTAEEPENPAWHALTGLLLIASALFSLLALISYDPADLPSWCHLAATDTSSVLAHNLIGRLGAVIAGYTFWMFGMTSYLIPACLTWFGVSKLSSHTRIQLRAWAGFGLVLMCGSAILHLQPLWAYHDKYVSPLGAGGGLGFVLGELFLLGIFGEVGSLLLLGVGYLMGFIFITGLHPIQVVMQLKTAVSQTLKLWWLKRELRKAEEDARRTLPPPDAMEARASRAKKRPAKAPPEPAGSDVPAAEKLVPTELPLDFNPPPKIIDASAPKPSVGKPQLSEVWKKRNAEKEQRVAFAPPTSLTARFKSFVMPPFDILNYPDAKNCKPTDEGALIEMQTMIIETLGTFDIHVTAGDITRGPAITRYEVYPSKGLRVNRIANLEADIARATKAERLNILAPIPGKDTVGIELPNKDKIVVPIRELLEDEVFQNGKSKLPLALGKDVYGKPVVADLAAMPHLLVAGATGSGKSVCINSIITSLLYRFAPDELRFIMIDPKVVEMQSYKDLPHLALPVVTDPKKALLALRWVVNEMEKRYEIFAHESCRNFDAFNGRNKDGVPKRASAVAAAIAARAAAPSAKRTTSASPVMDPVDISGADQDFRAVTDGESEDDDSPLPDSDSILDWTSDATPPPPKQPEREIPDTLPYIVVIVDELADLMQTAPADIEVAICRIAQKARAAGIHLILATQTPRADVVTGIIKANIPCRIAFQVSSALDSRVIMDRKGADKLVGKGDMLYLPPGTSQLIRCQGTMVTDDEIHDLIDHCCNQGKPLFEAVVDDEEGDEEEGDPDEVTAEDEAILEKVLDVIKTEKRASTSLIQRRLRLGYTRAARMMDILEMRGIIGPGEGAKPREILVEME